MTAIVPAGRRDDYFAVAVEPFTTVPFYETPAWRKLGLTEPERFKEQLSVPPDQFAFGKLMWAYEFLLEEWAGVEADLRYTVVLTVHDEEVGLDRHFSLDVENLFTTFG